MGKKALELLKTKCDEKNYQRLIALNNQKLIDFVAKYVEHCKPKSVFVCTDAEEDAEYIRNKSIENGEEKRLTITGHTIHYDGYNDQARDKENTRYLLPSGTDIGPLNAVEKEKGLKKIHEILKNIMEGKEMFVCFFCLGPVNSPFSIPACQLTDSAYVAHSELILYRRGYEEFKRQCPENFFKVVHSAGALENAVSKNVDERRVYIDLENYIVYSTNTQYAGNTVGFKKLSLRMAIYKAAQEDWLAEHMLIMGIHGPGGRTTYLTGAFPSMCGKTSTAMVKGETIVGDDLAYLRNINGKAYTVNVECGIFGIIQDVNPQDDPLIWEVLNKPGDVIFSNVLVTDENIPYWLGDGREVPEKGVSFSGEWVKGKKDSKGNPIPHAHKNARYTVGLYGLKNCDKELDNPQGIEIKGVIYGGRDSDTSCPVQEAFDWDHGVITMGAALESETTAATLGKEGVRVFNPMSNIDFVSIPLGRYISKHLEFGKGMDNPPSIFSVNYFLKDKQGKYMNAMQDKRIWLKWMDLRVNGDAEAIKTPVGYIPKYEDLKRLFKEVLDKDYSEEEYIEQFTLRIPENIKRVERIIDTYRTKVSDTPAILFDILEEQKQRLEEVRKSKGDYVSPASL
ncbi:MAG: phosphoenolpyruvate carboxykinase (GTP) [Deltaproteobacteria bacterium]|nr:MAG: phosphoenolpyruvate carboxykinase (GTP) [Deltaproteobacteria bacterium]